MATCCVHVYVGACDVAALYCREHIKKNCSKNKHCSVALFSFLFEIRPIYLASRTNERDFRAHPLIGNSQFVTQQRELSANSIISDKQA